MGARALIVVDYQNDFVLPATGALRVPGAEDIAPAIERWTANAQVVVLTQDWHRPDDPSFSWNGGRWPVHCVAGTYGAALAHSIPRAKERADLILRKRSYSAFFDDPNSPTGLHGYLREHWVDSVVVVGLALDHCVRLTATAAAALGYGVIVPASATKAVEPEATHAILEDLRHHGIAIQA
jgi:nicotinamidase/pyrazinamidase